MKRAAFAFVLAVSAPASAEPVRTIDAERVTVGDVVDSAADAAAAVDLGPAAPPGGSRLVTAREIRRHLRNAGIDVSKLRLPAVVRVKTAARRIEPKELATFLDSAIRDALPRGVMLLKVSPSRAIVVSPRATAGKARIPKLPKRAGKLSSTVTVDIEVGGKSVLHLPVSIVIDVSADAARADVGKGTRVSLVIERRAATVSTAGIALDDGDVGEVVRFRVAKTGRTVRAKIVSRHRARVIEVNR